jgi:putative metallohydrolase (TIGR04338 family)
VTEHVTQQFTLYAAEQATPIRGRQFGSQAEIQRWLLDEVLGQDWWPRRFPKVISVSVPKVNRNKMGSVGWLEPDGLGVLEMARVHWCEQYVLHELAHVCGDAEDSTGHDPTFARIYLELVFRIMGFGAWYQLRQSFAKAKVCFDDRCQELQACRCSNAVEPAASSPETD